MPSPGQCRTDSRSCTDTQVFGPDNAVDAETVRRFGSGVGFSMAAFCGEASVGDQLRIVPRRAGNAPRSPSRLGRSSETGRSEGVPPRTRTSHSSPSRDPHGALAATEGVPATNVSGGRPRLARWCGPARTLYAAARKSAHETLLSPPVRPPTHRCIHARSRECQHHVITGITRRPVLLPRLFAPTAHARCCAAMVVTVPPEPALWFRIAVMACRLHSGQREGATAAKRKGACADKRPEDAEEAASECLRKPPLTYYFSV